MNKAEIRMALDSSLGSFITALSDNKNYMIVFELYYKSGIMFHGDIHYGRCHLCVTNM